jgi:DNA-binding NarL/FixJ family response regulator
VLRAAGRHAEARRVLEDAVVHYEAGGEAYELARARAELARALAALGKQAAAEETAGAAAAALDAMGAAFEAERARGAARRPDVERRGRGGPAARPALTRRELDVLRLIAGGTGDRAAAERLALSEHTVHRHVSNILRKLGVPSRAAAVAHAARSGLL